MDEWARLRPVRCENDGLAQAPPGEPRIQYTKTGARTPFVKSVLEWKKSCFHGKVTQFVTCRGTQLVMFDQKLLVGHEVGQMKLWGCLWRNS